MAIARINGPMLSSNLERQGVNIAIDANLVYADVNNRRVGISNASPQYTLDVNGNAHIGNLYILNNAITSSTGKINLGSTANLTITGGSAYNILYTDGIGDVAFGSMATIAGLGGFAGNNIPVGTSSKSNDGFGTNALTTGMDVATAINTLDNILGNITNSSGNVVTTGNLYLNGVTGYTTNSGVLISDGTGATSFVNANTIPAIVSINANTTSINASITAVNVAIAAINANVTSVEGNTIILGANTVASLTSNAVTLTQTTKVTDAIAQLNYVLGKLVPPSPPNFPNGSISLTSSTTAGLMCNFVQTDNSGWGNLSVAGGTPVSAVRASTYTAGTITSVGPGNTGTVTAYLNGNTAGSVTLTGSSNGTYGNLIIASNQDYHNVVSTVTAGFWYSFNSSLSGSSIPAGWNRANIADSATGSSTNTITWYYDNSTPSTPTFSATSMVLSSNVVQYSSTIPMFTSGAGFTIKGNVTNLSGDTYYNSTNLFYTQTAGGAFAVPAQVTLTAAGISTPMPRNSTAVAQFTTTSNIISGFGTAAASVGPQVGVYNNYTQGNQTFLQGNIILYKTGTSTQIEETAITNSYTGGSAAYRIANPDAGTAADTPAYTGSEATFNSQTGPFYATDATNVAAKIQYDVTNYSSGYLPFGPNLSTRGAGAQYFTFKFVKGAVSKFNISYSGTIAGLWVALPGSTIDTTAAPTNGWINMAQAYGGSGIPGTGTGGNGSAGCSTGGAAVLNSLVSGGSYTCTFGTTSSTSSTGNEIYIRVKLTSGQSLTALSIANPTN